jgi:lipopolysaccharide heptosyltransferase II
VKALVVRLSSIGDVVHALPALAALKRHGHAAGWLVEPAALPLVWDNPSVVYCGRVPPRRGFSWRAARATLRQVRRQRFEVALDMQGLWKSAVWARLAGAPRVMGFAPAHRREPGSARLIKEEVAQPAEAVHVIDKNLSLLRPLGIDALGLREFPLPATDAERRNVAQGLGVMGVRDFVLLNPGGGWVSKQWPAESFGALAAGLRERGFTPLVTFGPGEDGLADAVVRASRDTALRGFGTTLLEYVELARRARLVIAADTGPLHLACAVGTPVVGIYGPTDPARNGPFAAQDRVVRKAPACAPCHKRVCPTHEGVMRTIGVEEVLAAAQDRLASARA